MNTLNIDNVGLALGLFLSVIYVLCVAFDLLSPRMAMYVAWEKLLPGFTWLAPTSFALELVESFLYGAAFAIVFVPIYNWVDGMFAERHLT